MSLPVVRVGEITQQDDGSALVELDLDAEALRTIIQVGFEKILLDHMEGKEKDDT